MQLPVATFTPVERLRGRFSNLQLTAGELAQALEQPFVPGPVDEASADRLARVLVGVENALLDADTAGMVAQEWVDDPRFASAARQARAGIDAIFDVAYDASLPLREVVLTGTIPAGLDAGPVAVLRSAASQLGRVARDVLAASRVLDA